MNRTSFSNPKWDGECVKRNFNLLCEYCDTRLGGHTGLTCVNSPEQLPTAGAPRIAAHEFLERGVSHMRDRAVQRDSEAGERSMARAVAAFNAQEGTNLTEAQGWRFMIQLKYARAVNGVFVADDYEDGASYFGLAGEAAQ